MLSRVMDQLAGEAGPPKLAASHSAHALLPWRRTRVHYAQNEVFVDVIETVDATLTAEGTLTRALLRGGIKLNTRLRGTPEITLSLRSNAPLDDIAIHHAVRTRNISLAQSVSLVPPDSPCTLMRYVVRDVRSILTSVVAQARIKLDSIRRIPSVSLTI